MSTLSPPPYRDKDLTGQAWQKWFAYLYQAVADNKNTANAANTTATAAQNAIANQSSTARSLATLTTTVDVSSSVAPVAGQVLIANNDVSATWQTLPSTQSSQVINKVYAARHG